jgi:hypothetical protein
MNNHAHVRPERGNACVDCGARPEALAHRIPIRFCTYSAPSDRIIGKVGGPNLLGEYLIAVGAETLLDGRQRVGWVYATENDLKLAGQLRRRPAARLSTPSLILAQL